MFGKRLQTLRRQLGFTQRELGEKVGLSSSTIGMYELGTREPGYTILQQLCQAMGVSGDYFLPAEEPAFRVEALLVRLRLAQMPTFLESPLNDKDWQQLLDALEIGARLIVDKKGEKIW